MLGLGSDFIFTMEAFMPNEDDAMAWAGDKEVIELEKGPEEGMQ